jgi:hypothetical protein
MAIKASPISAANPTAKTGTSSAGLTVKLGLVNSRFWFNAVIAAVRPS